MNHQGLDVVAFDDRSQKHPSDCHLPEWLPKHEFLMLIVAPAGSGKTTLILNILMRIYCQYWNRIYIFSPTIHNDAKWAHLKECKKLLAPLKKHHVADDRAGNGSDSGQGADDATDDDDEEWKANEELKQLKHLKNNEIIDPFHCQDKDAKSRRRRIGLSKQCYENILQRYDPHYDKHDDNKKDPLKDYAKIDSLASKMFRPPMPEKMKREMNIYNSILRTPSWENKKQEAPARQKAPKAVKPLPQTPQRSSSKNSKDTMISDDHMFEEYSEQSLSRLMTNIDNEIKDQAPGSDLAQLIPRTLWVFDDMVGSGLFSNKRNYAFKRLTVRRRHFYSSMIGVTQAYKEIPKTTRTNANCIILFRIDSDEELNTIYREYPMGLRFPDWIQVVKYCTQEPYSFILFNLQTSNPDMRIVKNFDMPLTLEMQSQIVGHSVHE